MDSHKLNVIAACDTNMVLWNSFRKSAGRNICKVLTHWLVLITLLVLGVGSVWYVSGLKTEMAKEYPEFNQHGASPTYESQLITKEFALNDHYNGTIFYTDSYDTHIKYGYLSQYCDQQIQGNS